jgi:hypothetical protein
MTLPLLTDPGLRRLAADVFGPEGLDAGMSEDEAARYAGPPPEPLGSTGLCFTGEHEIRDGAPCPVCAHGCANPGDPGCKGRE